jgi:hypothetical protein
MADDNRSTQVSLGCGSLILIALIVLFFSRGSHVGDLRDEVRHLRSDVSELKVLIEGQGQEIRQLREALVRPRPADKGP